MAAAFNKIGNVTVDGVEHRAVKVELRKGTVTVSRDGDVLWTRGGAIRSEIPRSTERLVRFADGSELHVTDVARRSGCGCR